MRKTVLTVIVLAVMLSAYLAFWPIGIEPVAWQPPPAPGYVGVHAPNDRLAALTLVPLGDHHGPEDLAVDDSGRVYLSSQEGDILVLDPGKDTPRVLASTGGRPLGIELDQANRLLVADAYRGLLRVDADGIVTALATHHNGVELAYVNDVAVAPDGRIYFSNASSRFAAEASGGTMAGSLLELMEHGRSGQLLMFDPFTGTTELLMQGLSFANGVAVSGDGAFVLVAETGEYRVHRLWLSPARKGLREVLIDDLPGFPDNLSTAPDGRFWLALVSPRNRLLDSLGPYPRLRAAIQRLPEFLRPAAVAYGHVVAFDADGQVLSDLQDPSGRLPLLTSAVEDANFLYLGSLTANAFGRLRRPLNGWPAAR